MHRRANVRGSIIDRSLNGMEVRRSTDSMLACRDESSSCFALVENRQTRKFRSQKHHSASLHTATMGKRTCTSPKVSFRSYESALAVTPSFKKTYMHLTHSLGLELLNRTVTTLASHTCTSTCIYAHAGVCTSFDEPHF